VCADFLKIVCHAPNWLTEASEKQEAHQRYPNKVNRHITGQCSP
jgi:hypothetical protein